MVKKYNNTTLIQCYSKIRNVVVTCNSDILN